MGTEPETFAHFLAAVAAQDDEEAESLVPALDREAASRLLRLAHAADPNIRWWSVRALADCGDGDAVAVISERLRDDDPAIRATAALRAWTSIY
ncbi:MAG: HEAT repeat domain-containing protein [Caldilineaceae bacterium]|nr:HEAT repeat domain-containing protein [Caldilineaceae bacterium]